MTVFRKKSPLLSGDFVEFAFRQCGSEFHAVADDLLDMDRLFYLFLIEADPRFQGGDRRDFAEHHEETVGGDRPVPRG